MSKGAISQRYLHRIHAACLVAGALIGANGPSTHAYGHVGVNRLCLIQSAPSTRPNAPRGNEKAAPPSEDQSAREPDDAPGEPFGGEGCPYRGNELELLVHLSADRRDRTPSITNSRKRAAAVMV